MSEPTRASHQPWLAPKWEPRYANGMISRFLGLAVGLGVTATLFAADGPSHPPAAPLPPGYVLAFEQHFDSPEGLRSFVFSDPTAWKFSDDGAGRVLELVKQSDYQPAVRSPFNIALIGDRVFGDFILEADLLQTGQEYGHRDMCLFFGVQDPVHFYYAHIATKTDDHAHNVFIVNDAPRTKVSKETTPGVNWGLGVWHRVRLERKDGVVKVFFDDMTQPIMWAEDRTLGPGWVGFGSFDDTGKVDNIRIWTPAPPERKPASFFRPAQ